MNILGNRPQPVFAGEIADWERFSREWLLYESILRQTQTAEIPDHLMFIIFRRSLDKASLDKLDATLVTNPHTSFVEFWQGLAKEFTRDPSGHYRREWQKIGLKGVRELTAQNWRAYRSAFELALSRVEDATEREIEEKIMAELPPLARKGGLRKSKESTGSILGESSQTVPPKPGRVGCDVLLIDFKA